MLSVPTPGVADDPPVPASLYRTKSVLDRCGGGDRHDVGDGSDLEPASDVYGGVWRSEDHSDVRGGVERQQRMADDGKLDSVANR